MSAFFYISADSCDDTDRVDSKSARVALRDLQLCTHMFLEQ